MRPANQLPRTRAGQLAVLRDHRAGDDGGVVTMRFLNQATTACRQIIHHSRQAYANVVEVDDVDIGFGANRQATAIMQAEVGGVI